MTRMRLACLVLGACVLGAPALGAAQSGGRMPAPTRLSAAPVRSQSRAPAGEAGREAMLQAIGMLAGQGLVLGHENLGGIFVRYENRLLPRDKAETVLGDMGRYVAIVLAAFRGRLMGQLTEQEKKDLELLIGFYEIQGQAVEALRAYVREGGGKNREAFEGLQERVAAIVRQISLGGGAS